MKNSEHVLLVHGLAETRLWMSAINLALRSRGYHTHLMDYPSTKKDIATLTRHYLGEAIKQLAHVKKLHIVTHSMGGIMLHYYLQHNTIPNLGRVVMLAPGHQGSPMISLLRHHPLFFPLMGPAGIQSADDHHAFTDQLSSVMTYEAGIIAGGVCADPLAWFFLPWPNDGRIPVEGTKLDGMKDHVVVAATHDTILCDPITLYQTSHFLEKGSFYRL